jgi:glutamate-1-semialdehyde 2,1-aminomutase
LRTLCDRYGALLVFDEVMTGFRVAPGGYMQLCGVRPDLVTLGKVIGGGLPIGAYGGRGDLMDQVAPSGKVYQAGTLSGNPLAVAAGLAMLKALGNPDVYTKLEESGARLEAGLRRLARQHGVALEVGRQGSMLCPYFSDRPVTLLSEVMATNRAAWTVFFHGLVERGVLIPPSPFEAWFLSSAHTAEVIERVLVAADGALADVRRALPLPSRA